MPLNPGASEQVRTFEAALGLAWRSLGVANGSVLLAISGGADSLALLLGTARVAAALGLRAEVATVDHGLRPEAAAEAEGVAARCATLGLPYHHVQVQVRDGAGLEAAARGLRYAALHAVRIQRGLAVVATAHTASDQAETLLMRLARGTSLAGAASIHAARADGVVRPLLFATRAEVEAYLTALEVPWATDAMNADPRFLRVRVRAQVLPALRDAAGPGVEGALARFAELAADDEAFLSAEAGRAWTRVVWPDGSLDQVGLASLPAPLARRVLARLLEAHEVPLDARGLERGLGAVRQGGVATLTGDRLLTCVNGRVRVAPAPPRQLHGTSPETSGRAGE